MADIDTLLREKRIDQIHTAVSPADRLALDLVSKKRIANSHVLCVLLSVKNPGENKGKSLNFKTKGKVIDTYCRLFLFRELETGDVFYVVAVKKESAFDLCKITTLQIGDTLIIYEPKAEASSIFGTKTISTRHPLIPITPKTQNLMTSAGPLESNCEVMLERCPNILCDGQHESSDLCPAVASNVASKKLSMQTEVELDGEEVLFTSNKLGGIFFEDAVLSGEKKISTKDVREHIRIQLARYNKENIEFIIIGWLKKYFDAEGRASMGPPHISAIYPCRILPRAEIVEGARASVTLSPIKQSFKATHGRTGGRRLATQRQHPYDAVAGTSTATSPIIIEDELTTSPPPPDSLHSPINDELYFDVLFHFTVMLIVHT